MTGHKYGIGIHAVCFSPDGSLIASASEDCTIRFWDGHTGEALGGPLTGHDGRVACIAFSPDGMYIVSACDDCTVRVLDTATGQEVLQPLQGHVEAFPRQHAVARHVPVRLDEARRHRR